MLRRWHAGTRIGAANANARGCAEASVDVQGDLVLPQAAIDIARHIEEAFAVAMFGANHAVAAEQRRFPTRKV